MNKKFVILLLISVLFVSVTPHIVHGGIFGQKDGGESSENNKAFVTCGSIIKLKHKKTKFRLHSHEVTYGSGSGQQSVTAYPENYDHNSYWVVGGKCKSGDRIKNGDIIQLEHMQTRRMLHSHHHESPLSGKQEVSAFGEDGVGDSGDDWKVHIVNSRQKKNNKDDGQFWRQGDELKLQHVETKMYLYTNSRHKFSRPIPGQLEVSGIKKASDPNTIWIAEEGVYFPIPEEEEQK